MLRAVSGNSAAPLTFSGRLSSDTAVRNTRLRALEDGDALDSPADPSTIDYRFNVQYRDWDGADVLPGEGAKTCFELTPPPGVKVYLGPLHRPLPGARFDLDTLQPCGGTQPPPPPPPTTATCGRPAYDARTTAGVVLWRNCANDVWQARVVAGGSAQATTYIGRVDASAAYDGVSPVALEADDVLDVGASAIAYRLNVANASQDGFSFSLPQGATACFRADGPAHVGSGSLAVTPPFRLDNLGPCDPP
jgi:hypothetical protein